MHVYELFLPQLNPKPGTFLQTRRAFSTEPQGDQLPLPAGQAQASTTYAYQRSPNYACKSWNLTAPPQNVRRSGFERLREQPCTSSRRCQDRAGGVLWFHTPKARCTGSEGRQQDVRLGDSYPERSLRGLPASSFSYLAKIYKMFYSQTNRKL